MTEAQQALIDAHMSSAEAAVCRFMRGGTGRDLEREDLLSAAYLGLVQAARAFDPSRGNTFKTLLFTSIQREFWKVSRQHRRATGWMYDHTGGKQTMKKIGAHVPMPTYPDGKPIEFEDVSTPDPFTYALLQQRRRIALKSAGTVRNRRILLMHLRGRSMRDIGKEVGLTGSRIQQLLPDILRRAESGAQRVA